VLVRVQAADAPLAGPMAPPAAHDTLAEDEPVARRLVELAAADTLESMRQAAAQGDWPCVDRLLEAASRRFAGSPWVVAMLESMRRLAASRERERTAKEMLYSSGRLRSRLAAKRESVCFSVAEEQAAPAFSPACGRWRRTRRPLTRPGSTSATCCAIGPRAPRAPTPAAAPGRRVSRARRPSASGTR